MKVLLIWLKNVIQRLVRPIGLRPSRNIGGQKNFRSDPSTDIGLELWLTGSFEKNAIAQCASYIQPDGVVIDIGANIGVHVAHFATLAHAGKVLCFEPCRSTFAYLLQNTIGLTNVIPLNLALSDESGFQLFFVAADDAYSGLKDTKRKPILRTETVACFKGDEILLPLVANLRVDLIKIDVEGLETQVLKGMEKFILAHRPVIFCEIFGGSRSNPDPDSTIKYCLSLGYDARILKNAKLESVDIHDDKYYNYFFLPKPIV